MSKGNKKNEVKKISRFQVINPQAAGIDVSEKEMVVAYPIGGNEIEVRSFESFTRDLKELVKVLKNNNIVGAAMESTGVYWIPLFLMLQENGPEVSLVNAGHVKNVTGRKDDEGDAERLQKLHRCGLLNASFQPDKFTRELRTLVRTRDTFVKNNTDVLNRMQAAMEQMNPAIQSVLSDIDGVSGIRIIEAVLSGERDARKLASLRDYRVKASEETVVKSLEATWSAEHLFTLEIQYESYKFNKMQTEKCDVKIKELIEKHIMETNGGVMPEIAAPKRKTNRKKPVKANLTAYLTAINGVNVTEIIGISEISALTILSEIGSDMSNRKNEKHFTSWLGLAPNTKISGGKIISSRVPRRKQHVGQAFRMAALSLTKSQSPLGDYYRRIRGQSGKWKAIVAAARKVAVIYYRMTTTKQAFNPQALSDYQKKYKELKIK